MLEDTVVWYQIAVVISVDCCLDVYQRRLVRRMINKSATKSGLYTINLPDSSHSAPRGSTRHSPIDPPDTRTHYLLNTTKYPSPLTIELKE